MEDFIRNSVRSILSRGPGYEPQPPGMHFDTRRPCGYFIDFSAKTVAVAAADPAAMEAADLAQLALGWWERHLGCDAGAESEFMAASGLLERRAVEDGDELLWPYVTPVPKHGLIPPWYSALAQAQAASVFVRAYLHTGDERFALCARGAVAPLLPASASGLLAMTPDGPVPEESPSEPPSLILNGWIYALWGLWDVAVALGDDRCRRLFDESALCLQRTLHRYDVGWWSRYSLYPHALPDLAKPFYHRLHVDQLELLYRLVGYPELLETSRRWARYDTAGRRSAMLVQKGLFLATV